MRAVPGRAAARPRRSGVYRPAGGPLREQKFVAGIFKPAAARAGLPQRLRFHDLRHTCASLLIAQGASVKAVQAQLGHASATVTLDHYGHLFPDELQQLADRLQDAHADATTDPAGRDDASPTQRGRSVTCLCWWRWGDSNSPMGGV
jgi:site-specific recombinase XerC